MLRQHTEFDTHTELDPTRSRRSPAGHRGSRSCRPLPRGRRSFRRSTCKTHGSSWPLPTSTLASACFPQTIRFLFFVGPASTDHRPCLLTCLLLPAGAPGPPAGTSHPQCQRADGGAGTLRAVAGGGGRERLALGGESGGAEYASDAAAGTARQPGMTCLPGAVSTNVWSSGQHSFCLTDSMFVGVSIPPVLPGYAGRKGDARGR